MAAAEAKREDRIDAVVIVTPTASHYEIAKVFL
jgi:predicted dehydrogenase